MEVNDGGEQGQPPTPSHSELSANSQLVLAAFPSLGVAISDAQRPSPDSCTGTSGSRGGGWRMGWGAAERGRSASEASVEKCGFLNYGPENPLKPVWSSSLPPLAPTPCSSLNPCQFITFKGELLDTDDDAVADVRFTTRTSNSDRGTADSVAVSQVPPPEASVTVRNAGAFDFTDEWLQSVA